MRPTPLKRLPVAGALAACFLVLSACAPATPRPSIEQARLADEDRQDIDAWDEYPDDMPMMPAFTPQMANVRKLGDSELSCAQIYAETRELDKAGIEQQARSRELQQAMAKSQEDLTKEATKMPGGGMGGIGSSLLGMVPGGSLVSGMAMQAAANARTSAIQDGANEMMRTQTELMNLQQELQYTQARSDHLAELFLTNGCKLSEVEQSAGQTAAAQ